MSLSAGECLELVDLLWESAEPPDELEDMTEEEFAAELDRRGAELRADPSSGKKWEEVQKMR